MAEPAASTVTAAVQGDSPSVARASSSELLKKYELEVGLYQFYLKISVQATLFAMGITGALLSYFFANHKENSLLVWALPIPAILNAGFFILFRASIYASETMTVEHGKTCEQLGIRPFDTNPLPALCRILSTIYLVVTIGLLVLTLVYLIKGDKTDEAEVASCVVVERSAEGKGC